MIEYNQQLKLQAYLDGELPEAEAREVANWLARDREAVALLTELRNTRQALAGFEAGLRVPESEDFYWSRIRREIERLEPLEAPASPSVPWFRRLRALLIPTAAAAVLAIAGLVVMQETGLRQRGTAGEAETAVADAGTFTYRDFAARATLVWLTYPAENEVAGDDPIGTMD
jgi:anti-sigma factor RsiW